jgi:hypothetical protein
MRDDVVISFDKGKQVMKIDKYLLCTESRFFAPMLDGPAVVSFQATLNAFRNANDAKRTAKHAASASAMTSPTLSRQ